MIDLRAEAHLHNTLVRRRLDELVPSLLEEADIDCWVLIGREYAEDPVLATMLPAEWLSARRRTILVLTPTNRYAVARYAVGISPVQAHADGLTSAEHRALLAALPVRIAERIVPAGTLGIRWLETRLPDERPVMADATARAHEILRRGLSREAIEPGTTTTDDLVWWYRQTVHDAGFDSWFQPSVTIQRPGPLDPVIRPGDLLHVDFGIIDRSMCTDQQEHAYVLEADQTSAPADLTDGLHRANRIQDILLGEFALGRTGNHVLAAARERAMAEGLRPTIYTHSIGLHGHGAGMTIGLWDVQDGVPGAGDHPLHANTAYSIELMGEYDVADWGGRTVRFMLEQDAWFDGDACTWLDARQEELWLV